MAKISTAKRCQETHPETNMEGSGLYNETSQHCWIPQGTAGPDGKKKKILNPLLRLRSMRRICQEAKSAEGERIAGEDPQLNFLLPGIHRPTCRSMLAWCLG